MIMAKRKGQNNGVELLPAKSGFDYSQLPASMRGQVMAETATIRKFIGQAARDMIQVGLHLEFVHSIVGRDRYQAWLAAEFSWSPSTASKWRRAAAIFGTLDCVDRFDSSALCILAQHKVPVAARNEALTRARRGEMITSQGAELIILSHINGAGRQHPTRQFQPAAAIRKIDVLFRTLASQDVLRYCAELEKMIAEARNRAQSDLGSETGLAAAPARNKPRR